MEVDCSQPAEPGDLDSFVVPVKGRELDGRAASALAEARRGNNDVSVNVRWGRSACVNLRLWIYMDAENATQGKRSMYQQTVVVLDAYDRLSDERRVIRLVIVRSQRMG